MTKVIDRGYALFPSAQYMKEEFEREQLPGLVQLIQFPKTIVPTETADPDQGCPIFNPVFLEYLSDGAPAIDPQERYYAALDLPSGERIYGYFLPLDPDNPVFLMYDAVFYDFNELNKLKASGLVLIAGVPSSFANAPTNLQIPSIAEISYVEANDETSEFTLISTLSVGFKRFFRVYNHSSDEFTLWFSAAVDWSEVTSKPEIPAIPDLTPLQAKDTELEGYFRGLEMTATKTAGAPNLGFSIYSTPYVPIVTRPSGLKVIAATYNSSDATLPRIVVNRYATRLSIFNYELTMFDLHNLPNLTILRLTSIGAYDFNYFPSLLTQLYIIDQTANTRYGISVPIALPSLNLAQIYNSNTVSLTYGANPALNNIEMGANKALTSLLFTSALPALTNLSVFNGSKITGVDFTKMPNLTSLDLSDNNLANVAGVPFSIDPLTKISQVVLRDAGLSQAAVDAILAQLVARVDFTGGQCYCVLNNNPGGWNTGNGYVNSAPSAAGIINYNILAARGCFVQKA